MKIAIAAMLVAVSATAAWAQNTSAPPATPPAKAPASAPAANPPTAPAAPKAPAAEAAAASPAFVLLKTDRGDIVLQLDPVKAPVTVANFLAYVKAGFYDGTVIHRSKPGFVIQGGGYDSNYVQKATSPPIKNEWTNGLKNVRGSISMARLPAPDSATSQFFLNLTDNRALDGTSGGPGYAVFGQIVRGMDVMDAIAAIPTGDKSATDLSRGMQNLHDVPLQTVTIVKATEVTEAEAKADASKTPAAAPATGSAPAGAAPKGK